MKRFIGAALGLLVAGVLGAPTTTSADHHMTLPAKPADVRPILVGTAAPDGALKTSEGKETTFRDAIGDRPAVVVFYRGHW